MLRIRNVSENISLKNVLETLLEPYWENRMRGYGQFEVVA